MTDHMGFGESIVFSLVGIALVFAVLVVLSLFIRALSAIIRAAERPRHVPAPAAAADAPIETVAKPLDKNLVPGAAGDILLHNVDDPTAAMVMAIVADELRLPLNELVFRSIRELSEDEADQEIASHEHHSL